MSSDVTIHPSTDLEPDDVLALIYSHMSEGQKADYLQVNHANAKRTKDIITGVHGICYVAKTGVELVGYIIGDEKDLSRTSIRYAELETILVLQPYRSQGIGTKLVQHFMRWCKQHDIQRISVGVAPANEAAIRFYKRFNFTPSTLSMEAHIS